MRLWIWFSLFALNSVLWAQSPEEVLRPQVDWSQLDSMQGKVDEDSFVTAMDIVYAPKADWRSWMKVESDGVAISMSEDPAGDAYFLAFGSGSHDETKSSPKSGFAGLTIVLDPGHIGGDWGPMEERSFRAGEGGLVQEGDLTLAAAERAAVLLRKRGARVFLTREVASPSTPYRPDYFRGIAEERLKDFEGNEEEMAEAVTLLAERLFYRTAEIRARAEQIRSFGKVDLVVALHVNASDVEDEELLGLHTGNDGHILVNGCYLAGELANERERFELIWRLVNGYHLEERELAFAMKRAMREATDLPPYTYEGNNAASVDIEGYIYARNLLANRIFDCPVVYLEPWQANSTEVYDWAAAGDYDGERDFGGVSKRSLPAEYADFVVKGLIYRFGE